MTNYRRNFLVGGSFFFTVNLADRRLRLLTEHVHLLRQSFRDVRRCHPFTIEAIVILPDHLHAIWTLPEGDADFALRWRLIKLGLFARSRRRRTSFIESCRKERTWRLAASLLGTYATR